MLLTETRASRREAPRSGSRPATFTINGRFLAQPLTGVQRYAREVTLSLDQLLHAEGRRARLLVPAGTAGLPGYVALDVVEAAPLSGHAWEQLVLPWRAEGPLLNLCNTGPLGAAGQVLCVHDANVHLEPRSYGRGFRLLYRTLQPALVRRGARIATVSHAAARQLAATLPLDERDVSVLSNGHEHVFRWDARRSTLFKAGPARRPFVLMLGSRARHKNMRLLLDLAPALDEAGLDLLIAGGGAGVFADIATLHRPNVRWLGRVDDNDLAALFQAALCLAFPSLTEGFGLPVLEAMALGCPVVASDRASLPEVCGPAALLASPEDAAAWLDSLTRLATAPALRTTLVEQGHQQAAKFSWRETAAGYLALVDELARGATSSARDPYHVAAPSLSARTSGAPEATSEPRPPDRPLSVAVIFATRGRPEILCEVVEHLRAQTRQPDKTLVCCVTRSDAGDLDRDPDVEVIYAPAGLARQRNAALDHLAGAYDIVVFFDDDFLPREDWLESAVAVFAREPDIAALTGWVVHDDIKGPGLTVTVARALLDRTPRRLVERLRERAIPYGCNMAFRSVAIAGLRFDPRLIRYAWLEDRDFGSALLNRGRRSVRINTAVGVHLGTKSGRVAGRMLGYSQVINPLYLYRKGTMAPLEVARHIGRNIAANLARAPYPEPYVDRRGRLRGNLAGLVDAVRGRVDPERAEVP